MSGLIYSVPEVRIMTVREVRHQLNPVLSLPETVSEFAHQWFESAQMDMDREHVLLFGLDSLNRCTFVSHIGTGTVNACFMSPREIFRPLVMQNCTHFIVTHNHPSGNLEPSCSDIRATRDLHQVSKMMRIELIDHVIITPDKNNWTSFREKGLLYG